MTPALMLCAMLSGAWYDRNLRYGERKMTQMTPDEIATMQADALAGTPGDWRESQRNHTTIITENGGHVASTFQSFKQEYRDEANARRIARVPRMEATITAQAAEIDLKKDFIDKALNNLEARDQEIYELTAENARLRESLERIEDYALAFPDLETVVSMARSALEAKP